MKIQRNKYHLIGSCLVSAVLFILLVTAAGSLKAKTTAGPGCEAYDGGSTCHMVKPYLVKEFTLDGPGILRTSTFSGNIEIRTIEGSDKVRVELYIERGYDIWSSSKDLDNYRIVTFQRGNEIIASTEQKTKGGFFGEKSKFSYKIYVPERISLELMNTGGNIDVSGVTGNHIMKTSAGNIYLKNVNGHIRAYTAHGDIEIRESSGTIFAYSNGGNILLDEPKGEIRVRANGGNIVSERVDGSFIARVDGGDIRVHFKQIAVGVSLETSGGDIFLELPAENGFDVELRGSEINLSDSFKFEGRATERNTMGSINDGGLPVNVVTYAGKITVRKNKQ